MSVSIDLRHMRHFVAVAEELHFGKAAKRLNIAQPPLSQSIRRLEADLGAQLFDRSRRGITVTPAGQVFLREARMTLAQADLATRLVRRAAEPSKEVKVGFINPALYRFLPGVLASFAESQPGTAVRLYEQPSSEQIDNLVAGHIDIAFASATLPNVDACETLIVEQAPLVAAMPANWALAGRSSVALAELAALPFILPPAQKFSGAANDTLSLFTKAGLLPTVTQESTHAHTTVSLVGAGIGYTLITATAALMAPRNVSFVPIQDIGATQHWGLAMVWQPEHQTQASRQFVAFVSGYVATHPELQSFDLAQA